MFSLAETSPRLPRLISRGDSGDLWNRKLLALTPGRRLRDVTATDVFGSHGDVSMRSPTSSGDVSETSSKFCHVFSSRGDVALLANKFSRWHVSETNWRLEKVSKESQKKSNMFDFTATPSRPAKSPGGVALTSPRPTETRVANRSPTSLHASEIGA